MEHTKTTTAARIYVLLDEVLKIEDSKFDEVVDAIDLGLTEWRDAISVRLKEKATAWETKMGGGDGTLYSLGLRHAIDIVMNYDPVNEKNESMDK